MHKQNPLQAPPLAAMPLEGDTVALVVPIGCVSLLDLEGEGVRIFEVAPVWATTLSAN